MRLRQALLGMAAILALGACVSAGRETQAPAAQAATAPQAAVTGVEAFRGSWVGATDGEGETRRAAALVIDASADGGLFLRWRSAEGARDGSTDDSQLKLREATVLFPPGKTKDSWATTLKDGTQARASLAGSVLTTELTAKVRGRTEVQTYRRTLTAPDRLSLRYTRSENGKVESTIDAEFAKLP